MRPTRNSYKQFRVGGYYWIGGIQDVVDHKANLKSSLQNDSNTAVRNRYNKIGLAIFAIVLALFAIFSSAKLDQPKKVSSPSKKNSDVVSDIIKIAIMPFKVSDPLNEFTENNIAFGLVEQIANEHKKITVVGPTTTSNFTKENFRSSLSQYQIDYVINGKFLVIDNSNKLLVEIIRTSDGKHIWVKSVEHTMTESEIIELAKSGLYEELGI